MKIISVDYDDTYTSDPELYESFIKQAQARGHCVVMVTFRNKDKHPITDVKSVEIFYTNGMLKADYMNSVGVMPDIWIDDMPQIIGNPREQAA